MKYIFLLGRNPILSKAELTSYLDTRKRNYKILYFQKNHLILEAPETEKFNIQEFGGILKIGKIQFEGSKSNFQKYIENNDLIQADKFSLAVYGDESPEPLKEKFKSEKRKVTLKSPKKGLKLQEKGEIPLISADFSVFLHNIDDKIYYAEYSQNYDYSDVKKRDMKKPVRREHLSISPRLSKILINLAGVKRGDHLLDPFCGIGCIVSEALIKNIKTTGIDIDGKAIRDANKNVEWLKNEFVFSAKYILQNLDSKKTPDMQYSGIATETPLGKVLRKKPKDSGAKKIIQDFESLIIPILTKVKKVKKPEAKIAITFPRIGKHKVNYKKIASKTDLKIILDPIEESRPDQFIARDILVLM